MISPNTIQQITNQIDIMDVVGEFVKLKKRGTNYLGLCPFHNEKSPPLPYLLQKKFLNVLVVAKVATALHF
jgi:DNA primase